jgi:hypothetical protein
MFTKKKKTSRFSSLRPMFIVLTSDIGQSQITAADLHECVSGNTAPKTSGILVISTPTTIEPPIRFIFIP